MGIEENSDEVNSLSLDHFLSNELQEAFEELFDKYCMLKKEHKKLKKKINIPSENEESLRKTIELLKSEKDNLAKENLDLKKKVNDVNNTLAKFVKGKETPDKILGS